MARGRLWWLIAGALWLPIWAFVAWHFRPLPVLDPPKLPLLNTAFVGMALAVMLTTACVIGFFHHRAGQAALALPLLLVAAAMPMLPDHRLAGAVLVSLDPSHGVHVVDFLALVPASIGLGLLWHAIRARRKTLQADEQQPTPSPEGCPQPGNTW